MLYLKSQKQTCAGALESAIRKEDKTEKDYVIHEQPVQSCQTVTTLSQPHQN